MPDLNDTPNDRAHLIRSSLSSIAFSMEIWQSKLGFLIVLDISEQEQTRAGFENFFSSRLLRGGEGVDSDEDRFPRGVISLLIFAGKRMRPSDMRS